MQATDVNALLGAGRPENEMLERAARCGVLAGVSRVADLTGLDVLGVPVCQSVRPWSRALSVHQGKGLTIAAAQIGALMEAVECDAAEAFAGHRLVCAHADLPPDERAPAIGDFGIARGAALDPDAPLPWTPARRLTDGGRVWVPWEAVSLDLTFAGDPRLERSSNGLGAGFTAERAHFTAVCELLERDALVEWRASPQHHRALDVLDFDTLPDLPWLTTLREALAGASMRLRLYAFASVIDWPVMVCLIEEPSAADRPRGRVYGSACRPGAEATLQAAVLEAVQTRLTAISATRDDILPTPRPPPGGFAFAPPLPPHLPARHWDSVPRVEGEATAVHAAERLATAGYLQACIVDLPSASREAVVVKAFAPGLGTFDRRRRRHDA